MGNRLWITAQTPLRKHLGPRVRAADDHEDTGWQHLPVEWRDRPPLELLEEAWKRSPKIASVLNDCEENETDTYLNDADLVLPAFLAQVRARQAAQRREQRLEHALPVPEPAPSSIKPRL